MNLNDKTIRTLTRPEAGKTDQCFWDSDLHGFGLRVRAARKPGATCARTWIVQYDVHGRSQRISLGKPSVVTAAAARARAKDLLAAKQLGGDPAADKARARVDAANTVGALLPRYLDWKGKQRRKGKQFAESTLAQTKRDLMRHLAPLHREPVANVDRAMIAKRLTELAASSGPGGATRTRSSWSAFFTWVAKEGLIESNPVLYTNPPQEQHVRDHMISHAEIGPIWRALDGLNADYVAIVRLLMLTGARREMIAGLARHEIDLDAALISLPAERMKNGLPHLIPLSAPAVAILRAQMERQPADRALVFGVAAGPFAALSQSKSKLDEKLGDTVQPFVLHDLRRTISTSLREKPFSVPHEIVETILAHVVGSKVSRHYNFAEYLDERRDALDRWAAYVLQQVAGGNVVHMAAA